MKKLYKLILTFIITGAVLWACSDDFLDAPAQGVLDDKTLANQLGVEGNLISAYSLLDGWAGYGGWGGAGSNWIFGSVASDNAYKGSEPGDQQPTQDVELYQWSTGGVSGYLNDKWRVVYDGVKRANATITLLESVEDISDDDRDRILGEALFLRAHYHFEAWKFWKNVPYYTEDDEDFKKTNVGTDPVPLMLKDLDDAIAILPTEQDDIGRVTQWTAKAYKGRIQVYSGDYAGGLTTLRDVEANGPYDLEECYHDVFSAFHDNGKETVLAYQASSNDGNPNGDNGNRNDRLNFPHGGSPFGCCGFHQPSQNLVNAFKVDADGLPMLDGSFNNADVAAGDPVDPRLDWTVGRDDVPFLDWGVHAPGWIRDRSWAGPYSPKKNIYEKNSPAQSSVGWANYQLHAMNMHLYRYADVLLLLAEAEVEAGSLENARDIVNRIRTRAANCAQGPDGVSVSTGIDDAAITWANYQIGTYDTPWTDQAVARNAVRMERRLELAMEGHRLFDLRRWGIAAEVLNSYIDVEKTKRNYLTAASKFEAKHATYPIPQPQIEVSKEGSESTLVDENW
ncbi:RagB/SusD family nutrient uptake outer membrane protein [Marinoscillum furvescens]|uniref:Putative outer membrane starch-binding protein n=1 Tax=Marinoscillum furvescens DSM 4134 TaxID=1122208 RepID=A0A3D9L3M8_MARFU|nr:RagB/SusD family nutrient uptake outer membrane protein [Marinoscillum furvescens]RED99800.1 putative outer membrane starch-binding protein [Marinoscillum furvescens DSM 4134]